MTWKPGLPGFENHQEQCGWCNAGVTNGGQEVFCQPPGRWWSHGTKPWGADGEEVGIPALASRTGLKDRIFGFHVGCAQTHLTSCTKSYTWSKETYACQHWFSVQIIAGIASFGDFKMWTLPGTASYTCMSVTCIAVRITVSSLQCCLPPWKSLGNPSVFQRPTAWPRPSCALPKRPPSSSLRS